MSAARAMMRLVAASLILAACGHPGPKAARPTDGTAVRETPQEDEKPPQVEKVKPLRTWHAKAALTPVKGSKLKPTIVSFDQTEDSDTVVTSDPLQGAKSGTYHLVIHDGSECGPDSTKAGGPWQHSAGIELAIVVNKDLIGSLDKLATELALGGDHSIVGHTLVLHDDKKGKAGKALACGVIEEAEE